MLKQRIITAVILIPVFLSLIIWMPFSYVAGLLLLVMLLGSWEWGRLIGLSNPLNSLYLLILIAVCIGSVYIGINLSLYAITFWLMAFFLLWFLHQKPQGIEVLKSIQLKKPMLWKFVTGWVGILVLAPAWASLVSMGQQANGIIWVLTIFLLVWTADIAAYFCGKAWGKRKLSLVLSPGKSWEGVLGGGAFVVIIGAALTFWLPFNAEQKINFVILCAVISVVSVVGDLFQSLLKRVTGVKDSGQLLPGHGGILDRIDSITAAAPVFLVGLTWLGIGS